ncbi:Preferentially expressed antigen in melanoma-like protein 1 [Lemmus lemmus]
MKVLNLRFVPFKMWDQWSVFKAPDWSKKQAEVGLPETEVKPQVKVAVDLVLQEQPLNSLESFVVEWVAQREGLSLCCINLEIWSLSSCYHKEVLKTLDMSYVQELGLYSINDLTSLLNFSPYLGRMRNLCELLLSSLSSSACHTPVEKQQVVTQFTSQFVKLKHLQALVLKNVSFLQDHLDQLFWRCRLKVLDLRCMPLKMWDRLSVFKAPDWSETQAEVGLPENEVKPQVKVAIDLVLQEQPLKSLESFVVEWVTQREGLSLCCINLEIWSRATDYHNDFLKKLDLNSVQQLGLYNMNDLTCLLNFTPYLGRMRNLRELLLSSLSPWACHTPVEKQQVVTQFTSRFVKLKHLQALHLDSVLFLEDHLDQLFWRCRLKVLDLRCMPLKMWDRLSVFKAPDWSETQAEVGLPETEVKPQVKVAIDLVLQEQPLKSLESFVVEWVAQREGLSLCCINLEIWSLATDYHNDFLKKLDLNSVQQLGLYNMNDLTCLLNFTPYLGRMRNLRELLLSSLSPWACHTPVEKQQVVTQFTSQFVKLKHLQSLHLDSVLFLEDHLDQLFWCLKSPLGTLFIIPYLFTQSDLDRFSQCQPLAAQTPEPE